MKLFFKKGACSLTIRIIAHELGLKLDYEAVDLHDKVTASGQNYLLINPKGSVPALVLDDGSVLTENIAILQYLADTHPTSMLPPMGDEQRYRVIEWLSFMATDLHKSFAPMFNPKVPQDIRESIFIPILKNKLLILDLALSGKNFLMGDTFTLPDAYCFVCLRWVPANGIDLQAYPQLFAYFDRIRHRKMVQEALNEEE